MTEAGNPHGDGDARQRLARLVKARRLELRRSTRAIAAEARIDRDTWGSLEKAERQTAEYHYAGIERVLRWQPGSVEAILAGDDPKIIDDPLPGAKTQSLEERMLEIRDDGNRPQWMRTQAGALLDQIEALIEAAEEEERTRRRGIA